eukprot:3325867-Pyramimonas_sp.AAC.2
MAGGGARVAAPSGVADVAPGPAVSKVATPMTGLARRGCGRRGDARSAPLGGPRAAGRFCFGFVQVRLDRIAIPLR